MNANRPIYLVAATLFIVAMLSSTVARVATQNLGHILFLRVTGTDASPLLCLVTQEKCQQLAADKATTFEIDEQSYTIRVSSQVQPDLIATWQIPESELTTLAEGALHYAASNHSSAVSLWKQIPLSAELFANLARQSQDSEKSIQYYSIALNIAPSPTIYYELGQTYLSQGNDSKALTALSSALAVLGNQRGEPIAARIYAAVGNIYRTQNELSLARENYLYALELDPHHRGALVGIARTSKGNEQYEAQQFLEDALRTSSNPQLYYELAKLYVETGQEQRALELLRNAPILESEFAPVLRYYGELAREFGCSKEAIQAFSAYLTLRPDDGQIESILEGLRSEHP